MEEYYLNNSKCCAKLPTRSSDYLQQSNFLSEFSTKDDKQEARDNLGVTELLNELKALIDNKIIRYGGVAWDLKPIQGHSDRVLSSDAIYKTLLDYATEKELNSKITSLWSLILNKIDDLEQRINSYTENGIALSNKFGDSETIGVSQKALTNVVNDLYSKLASCGCSNFSGMGIVMTVTPDSFVSNDGAYVHITVYPNAGVFEDIKVYLKDGDLDEILVQNMVYNESKSYYETLEPILIHDTTRVRAEGIILGIPYYEEKYIMKKKAFYIGSGSTWNEVENVVNLRDLNSLGKYDVRVNRDGDFIFIIVDNSEAQNIIMLDNISTGQPSIEMNGMVIPMTTEIDNLRGLTIYKSKNRYQIGGYSITINYEQQD